MTFTIDEVTEFETMWPELEVLLLGIIEYHRPWEARKLRQDWSVRMRQYMASGGVTLLARDATGEAVGFLSGNVKSDFGLFEETPAHIDNAFVLESYRRQGIGEALLQRFENWCRERGADDITLDVAHGNDLGLAFWQKSGFRQRMQVLGRPCEAQP